MGARAEVSSSANDGATDDDDDGERAVRRTEGIGIERAKRRRVTL